MRAIKCDRCGGFYLANEQQTMEHPMSGDETTVTLNGCIVTRPPIYGGPFVTVDLCDKCCAKLVEFLTPVGTEFTEGDPHD